VSAGAQEVLVEELKQENGRHGAVASGRLSLATVLVVAETKAEGR